MGSQSKSMFDDGNVLCFVDLPEVINGNKLILHYYNDNNYTTLFELKNIRIAKRINIISYYFLHGNLVNGILIVFMVTTSIVILLTGNIFKKAKNNIDSYFNNIALLCFVLAAYMAGINPISYFVLNKIKIFLHILSYTGLMLIPIMLLNSVKHRVNQSLSNIFVVGVIIGFVNILYQYIVTSLGYKPLTMMTKYTYIVILCSVLIVIYAIISTKNSEENNLCLMTFSIAPLVVAIVAEVFVNLKCDRLVLSTGFKIGVFLFGVFQVNDFLRLYISYRDKKIQADTYKKLAYTDNLTNIGNRQFFSEKINSYIKSGPSAYFILLDIDNLKYVNDNFGHKYGDAIIRILPVVVSSVFDKKYKLEIFRVGGDEFFVIYESPKQIELNVMLENLSSEYSNYDVGGGVNNFGVSYGYCYYDFERGDDLQKIINIADKNMYQNKSNKKSNSK